MKWLCGRYKREIPCQHCGKLHNRYTRLKQPYPKTGSIQVPFCCYKCYLEFWKDVHTFEPLEEFIEPTPVFIVPKITEKKRVRVNPHRSYKKPAYCF